MIKIGVISLFFFFLMLTGGLCLPQESGKYLIDAEKSKRIHHEIDSLYLVGDYSRAIDETLILLAYYRKHEDFRGQIVCNNYMGDFLRACGNRSGSLEYLYKALALKEQLHDSLLRAQTYNYLAATYFEYEYPIYLDSSKMYGLLSMGLAITYHDEKLEYSNLNILGKVKEGKGDLDSALVYLTRALEIVKRINPVDESLVLINIAGVYFNMEDIARAGKYAIEAYELAKQYNINTYIRMTSALLERIYVLENNYRKAHFYLGELIFYTRNFLDETTEERVTVMKEQIRLVQEEAEVQKEMDRRRLWTLFLLILIGCSMVFIFIFARQKNRLKRTNRELLVMNQEIRIQQQETEKLAQELEISNTTLKKFISIIAHDLKNPFNTIIGFSDLLHTEFNILTPEERKLAIENTHKSAVSAYALLEHLLSWARLQTGAFNLEVTTIELSDLIDEVVNLLQTSAFLKKQKLVNQIPANIEIRVDRNMMLTVFRNILSNAIKFTPELGMIEVMAIVSDESVNIQFKDSGVGIPQTEIGKLFSIDEPFKTSGTNGEKGTGIGLLLCREYLEKNGGTILVESQVGTGTVFTVKLPLFKS